MEIKFNPDDVTHDERLDFVDSGDSEALNGIGASFYNNGDYKMAREYYELASALGNDTAMSNLGYIYMYGRNVEIDYTMAMCYFMMAAKKGNIEAIYKLGNLYESGKCGIKDVNLAMECYDKALLLIEEQGIDKKEYPSVYFTLAKEMMPNGNKKQDLSKAYEYLKTAVSGYKYLIENESADYYKKVLDEAKKMLELEIFSDYK